jgi:hypothetical protein
MIKAATATITTEGEGGREGGREGGNEGGKGRMRACT